ncbi:hypothetical protein OPQ81_011976 [Rhizoctonia solani]|nr:hypothetical protein OPQ81_011976 [Rhizoctonia solani]
MPRHNKEYTAVDEDDTVWSEADSGESLLENPRKLKSPSSFDSPRYDPVYHMVRETGEQRPEISAGLLSFIRYHGRPNHYQVRRQLASAKRFRSNAHLPAAAWPEVDAAWSRLAAADGIFPLSSEDVVRMGKDPAYTHLMCHADLEAFTFMWREGQEKPYADFGIRKTCVDFDYLLEWNEAHRDPRHVELWAAIEKPEGVLQHEAPPDLPDTPLKMRNGQRMVRCRWELSLDWRAKITALDNRGQYA